MKTGATFRPWPHSRGPSPEELYGFVPHWDRHLTQSHSRRVAMDASQVPGALQESFEQHRGGDAIEPRATASAGENTSDSRSSINGSERQQPVPQVAVTTMQASPERAAASVDVDRVKASPRLARVSNKFKQIQKELSHSFGNSATATVANTSSRGKLLRSRDASPSSKSSGGGVADAVIDHSKALVIANSLVSTSLVSKFSKSFYDLSSERLKSWKSKLPTSKSGKKAQQQQSRSHVHTSPPIIGNAAALSIEEVAELEPPKTLFRANDSGLPNDNYDMPGEFAPRPKSGESRPLPQLPSWQPKVVTTAAGGNKFIGIVAAPSVHLVAANAVDFARQDSSEVYGSNTYEELHQIARTARQNKLLEVTADGTVLLAGNVQKSDKIYDEIEILPPPTRFAPYSGVPQARDTTALVRPVAFRPLPAPQHDNGTFIARPAQAVGTETLSSAYPAAKPVANGASKLRFEPETLTPAEDYNLEQLLNQSAAYNLAHEQAYTKTPLTYASDSEHDRIVSRSSRALSATAQTAVTKYASDTETYVIDGSKMGVHSYASSETRNGSSKPGTPHSVDFNHASASSDKYFTNSPGSRRKIFSTTATAMQSYAVTSAASSSTTSDYDIPVPSAQTKQKRGKMETVSLNSAILTETTQRRMVKNNPLYSAPPNAQRYASSSPVGPPLHQSVVAQTASTPGGTSHVSQSSHNSSGIHVTPSPSDSATELEVVLREKELELLHLRQTMEQNEQSIMRVCQEKEERYQEKIRDWANRLESSITLEQKLLSQVQQLQEEKRVLEGKVTDLIADKHGLQRKYRELEQEYYQAQRRHSAQSQGGMTMCAGCSQLVASHSGSETSSLRSISGADRSTSSDRADSLTRTITLSPYVQAPSKASSPATDGGLRSDVDQLRVELLSLRQNLQEQLQQFGEERANWEEERQKVVQFQKTLQANYLSVFRRNRSLERQLNDMATSSAEHTDTEHV